jgi:hypothetical protein
MPRPRLLPGLADNLARTGVDIDPDDLAAAHELQAVAARFGIEFGPR